MLTESFIAATLTTNKAAAHASAALKDVGIFLYQYQPQNLFSHGYKKSTSRPGCVAVSDSHVFAAQADKAVINVYSRERGNQEATVPFPERISCIAFVDGAALLVLGTEEGNLTLWEVATGRLTTSSASHLQSVSSLCITPNNDYIISGSADTSIHIWSLPKLVSFSQTSDGYGNGEPSNAPVRSFTAHRTAISALACGHSMANTNFAVSASDDGTCYLWHIGTSQILRTILLPTSTISIAIDPADRALYLGGQDGHVYSWNVFQQNTSKSTPTGSSGTSTSQLTSKDRWTAPSSELGSTNCLTLSYDGTSLVSGHMNGSLVRWDVAKHRILNELTNLGQPVTYVEMLKLDGLQLRKTPAYKTISVVKPNLEFASQLENGTIRIPSRYNFYGMITPTQAHGRDNDIEQALTGSGFPQSMIDDALRALITGPTTTSSSSTDGAADFKMEKLSNEVNALKQQLAVLNELEEKRKTRRIIRMERREELGMKKRRAYFEAQKKGKDGDTAMKKWEEKETELDDESDDEYREDGMITD